MRQRSLLILFILVSAKYIFAQCSQDFDLGNDTALCTNESLTLSVNPIYDSYVWHNNSGLNTIVVNGPGTYYCTAEQTASSNLIANGDFELGNTSFTTDYTYYPIADVFGPQASYGIINNANTWFNPFNACTDHTSGNGQMMVIDGSAFNGGTDAIWCQSVNVVAGSQYEFSYWIQSVTGSNVLADIQLQINGAVINNFLAPFGACTWQQRVSTWTSPVTGIVDFCLYDLELSGNGNDFALDDIALFEVCEYSDTIVVSLAPNDTINNAQEICPGDSVLIGGVWQFNEGTYYELNSSGNCIEVTETVLSFRQIDTLNQLVEICPGDSLFLENEWQTAEGIYYDFVSGAFCDDVQATNVVWTTIDTTFLSEEICENDSLFVAGAWRSNPGVYYEQIAGLDCDEILATSLIVNALPTADAGDDLTLSFEQVVTISADNASGSVQVQWSTTDSIWSNNESFEYEVDQAIQTFYLELTDNGCVNYDTLAIFGIPLNLAIRVPNAFSPNSDGINDVFRIVNADEFESIDLKIYNRWGEKIYFEQSANPMWDGLSVKGALSSLGVYTFYIEASPFGNVDKMVSSGTLSLIR